MPNIRIASGFFTAPHNLLTCAAAVPRDPEKSLPRIWGGYRFSDKVTLNQSAGAATRLAMNDDPSRPAAAAPPARKPLTPAAERALAEAEARRQAAAANAKPAPNEYNGPKGPEPTRYGDWEIKGIASDF
jgi:hypothetical protein